MAIFHTDTGSIRNLAITGNLSISGSSIITGSLRVSGSITGSLEGTSSWAANANWGTIRGTISNQTDLNPYLLKVDDVFGIVTKTANQLVDGNVFWSGIGLDFSASAHIYYIQSVRYNAPQGVIALPAANPTLPRLDVIFANTNGTYGFITGSPDVNPVKPVVDPDTQLELTIVSIGAGATVPSGISITDVYKEGNGFAGNEWSASAVNVNGATVNFTSSISPFAGSRVINVSKNTASGLQNTSFRLTSPVPVDFTNRILTIAISSSQAWTANNNTINITPRNGNTPIGSTLLLRNQFGFSPTSTQWQKIAIPTNQFGLTNGIGDNLLIAFSNNTWFGATSGSRISFDDIQIISSSNTINTISLTGDLVGNGPIGSAITTTLANVNTTPGTFGSATQIPVVTVNAKGLVTAISTQSFDTSSFVRNSQTASFATTGSNTFRGGQIISGSLTITDNFTVQGSASITIISQSTLNIATNLVTVNTVNPGTRFGGLAVIDSGSSPQTSGSFLYDSVRDNFIFLHRGNGINVTSSIFLLGPESSTQGNETYLTQNRLSKGTGTEHLNDSNITDNGSIVSINSNTQITGSLNVSAGITASLQGTASWATNALTASFVPGLNTLSSAAIVQGGNTFSAPIIIGTNDNQNLQLETANTARLTISSSGGVGIGTNPTNVPLTINNPSTIGGLNITGAAVLIGTVSDGLGIDANEIYTTGSNLILGTLGPDSINFRVNSIAASTTAMTISSSGFINTSGSFRVGDNLLVSQNIGIGVGGPTERIDMIGTIRSRVSDGAILFAGGELTGSGLPTGDGIRIRYEENLFAAGSDGLVFEKTDVNNIPADGGIMFANLPSGSTQRTASLVIRGTGNVGIGGITDPTVRLDVSGSGRFTTALTVTGSTNLTGSLNINGNTTITTGSSIQWIDQNSIYPTSTGSRVRWSLNNDSAEIYAWQPIGDKLDLVFKTADNAAGPAVDEFVYWIDSSGGEALDGYPMTLGESVIVNPIRRYALTPSNSGSGNTDFNILRSGSFTTTGTNSVFFADVSEGRIGIGTTTPAFTLDTSGSGRFTNNLTVSGSLFISGAAVSTGINNVLTYNTTNGLIGFTSSNALGGGGGTTVDTSSLATTGSNTFRGSQIISGSLTLTGSVNALSFTGSLSGTASFATSSSFATSASFFRESDPIFTARSGSLATTGSNTFTAGQIISGTLNVTQTITGNLTGTASFATNANNADLLDGIDSLRFATTGSNTFRGPQTISGSLIVTQSATITGGDFTISTGSGASNTYLRVFPGGNTFIGSTPVDNAFRLEVAGTTRITNTLTVSAGGIDVVGTSRINGTTTVTGSTTITGSLRLTGSAAITNALTASFGLFSASVVPSASILSVYGSGSDFPVFTVRGSQGELFAVTDSLSGSLFSVNNISGLPILEVFSDNTTRIGIWPTQALYTSTRIVANSGSNTIYSLQTGSFDAMFVDYTIRSGSNARAGQVMTIWSGSETRTTDVATTSFGNTNNFEFTSSVVSGEFVLQCRTNTNSWIVKTIIRGI